LENSIDYLKENVEAARRVLLEIFRILGAYSGNIVLIGGWVPELMYPNSQPPHTGSMDIDIALNHLALQEIEYRSIERLLLESGYIKDEMQPFIFLERSSIVYKRTY
jgi:hypothetical protein